MKTLVENKKTVMRDGKIREMIRNPSNRQEEIMVWDPNLDGAYSALAYTWSAITKLPWKRHMKVSVCHPGVPPRELEVKGSRIEISFTNMQVRKLFDAHMSAKKESARYLVDVSSSGYPIHLYPFQEVLNFVNDVVEQIKSDPEEFELTMSGYTNKKENRKTFGVI